MINLFASIKILIHNFSRSLTLIINSAISFFQLDDAVFRNQTWTFHVADQDQVLYNVDTSNYFQRFSTYVFIILNN